MYISAETVCKKALESNELLLWLRGEDDYAFPPDRYSDGPGPDYITRMSTFCSVYRSNPEPGWLSQFYDCILMMLRGEPRDIQCALTYLAHQFRLEYKNSAAFIPEPAFLDEVRGIMKSRMNKLQRERATRTGFSSAWEEIEDYNRSVERRYGKSFL